MREKLLSETESARVAGVSADTIRLFRTCGLLDPVVRNNEVYFNETDIQTLFYTKKSGTGFDHDQAKDDDYPEEQAAAAAEQPAGRAPRADAFEPSDIELPEPQPPDERTPRELVELAHSLREQVQLLKDERDWLRERVEKLESRAEREQMLLLSERETIRTLVGRSRKKKRFLSAALPWFNDDDRGKE